MAVGERGSRALLDLGQAGISDRRVGLDLVLGLDRLGRGGRVGNGFGLGNGLSMGNGDLLDLGDWELSVLTLRYWYGEHVQVVCRVSPVVLRVCSSAPSTSFSMVETAFSSPE